MRILPRRRLIFATVVALTLGLAPVAAADDRVADPVGDGPPGFDIVSVTSSIDAARELVIVVELADRWPAQPWVVGWLVPNPATYQHESFGMHPGTCDAYGTGYGFRIWEGAAQVSHHEHDTTGRSSQPLEYRVAGSLLTVAVPLSFLGHPDTLGVALATGIVGGPTDTFPDGQPGACHSVPLMANTAVTAPFGAWPSLVGWLLVLLAGALVVGGIARRPRT